MALINCPECGKEVSDKSEKCVYCGYPLNKQRTDSASEKTARILEKRYKDEQTAGLVLSILLGIFGVACVVAFIVLLNLFTIYLWYLLVVGLVLVITAVCCAIYSYKRLKQLK